MSGITNDADFLRKWGEREKAKAKKARRVAKAKKAKR